ncbi:MULTISPECIES: type III glutamate--ammonia ligase [unclassified Pantoea]|uniref:type III glutamate--ammonia ligase n=1 Tax=unclassified Pantoea TaxID=2630326 RepID=UPI0025555FA4|nr:MULTISPECIES: type III glutamate--ammonia ligase [unclassified Pantoea]
MSEASVLKARCKEEKIDFILASFSDLFGIVRSKLIPVSAIDTLIENGAAFAGFAAHFNLTPADPDIVVHPDVSTFTPLPWRPGVAWITGDLYTDGHLFDQSPRNQLRLKVEDEKRHDRNLKTGVEAEFFLLNKDDLNTADAYDAYHKPCYDQTALMRSYHIISEICKSLDILGWSPYQNDHEDANGQFEINWKYSDALTTADRHTFFKFAVKSIAEKHGVRASFMPKIFNDLTGNGCHIHCSVWNNDGKNIFLTQDAESVNSSVIGHFTGGLLKFGGAISALTNPTINSYKRLGAITTSSGSTWVSQRLSWSGDDRTHAVRIPDKGRIEYRIPDGSANPYLLQLGVMSAGMIGITECIEPGKSKTAYSSDGSLVEYPQCVENALTTLEGSHLIREYIGNELATGLIKLRRQQLHSYNSTVSSWEHMFTLDC